MERELRFDLNVQDGAILQANPQEFFAKAYLDSEVADNYRVLPNIKSKVKIAIVMFASMLAESGCAWAATDSTLDAVEIDVCAVSAMAQVCQFDIEQSFVSAQMAQGSNSFEIASFMSYYWAEMASEIKEEVELIRWQGDTGGTFTEDEEFLALCDGYEVKLDAAALGVTATLNGTGTAATLKVNVSRKGVIQSVDVLTAGAYSVAPTVLTLANTGGGTGATFTIATSGSSPSITVTGITVTNGGKRYQTRCEYVTGSTALAVDTILTELNKVYAKLPKRIRRRKDLLRLYMSPVAADLYRLATASANTQSYITTSLALTFLDIKIVVADGISDNTMVMTRASNLIYAFDGATDGEQLKAVNLGDTTNEPIIRTRANLKVGFYLVNHEEIVYYKVV
jgi:hypothetical protein